jgi:Domain of unknown function (DUF4395)
MSRMQLALGGRSARPTEFNENEVRAAAGITLVVGAVAFSYAYFKHIYIPLQVASTVFFIEFLVRVTIGLRSSPIGLIARLLTRDQRPNWVSAKPKRFAWTLGLALAFSMTIITNSGVRGTLPRTLCAICLTLMWLESALGLCVGCKLHALAERRGWTGEDPDVVCANGVCELPERPAPTCNLEGTGVVVHNHP